MRRTTSNKPGPSEWDTEADLRTLSQAARIRNDKPRLKRAQKMAQERLDGITSMTKNDGRKAK